MSSAAVPQPVPVTLVTESMSELFSVVEAERTSKSAVALSFLLSLPAKLDA